MAGALITLTTVGAAHHYRSRRLGTGGAKKESEKKKRRKEERMGYMRFVFLLVSLICCIRPQICLRKDAL